MSEPIFECANIPIKIAARALKMDSQTVRLLLQSGTVNWELHTTEHQRADNILI